MSSTPDHHLDATSNVQFALGDYAITILPQIDAIENLLDSVEVTRQVVGIRLSPRKELFAALAARIGLRRYAVGALSELELRLADRGWIIEESIAVLPGLDTARFVFPNDDASSHRFLIHEFLVPRRYSLPLGMQFLLRVYGGVLKLFPEIQILYRGLYVRIAQQ